MLDQSLLSSIFGVNSIQKVTVISHFRTGVCPICWNWLFRCGTDVATSRLLHITKVGPIDNFHQIIEFQNFDKVLNQDILSRPTYQ